jgi:hypothetical protein
MAVVVLGLLAYLFMIRPWLSHWGATEAELQLALPADALVAAPDFDATRAVTIDARPEDIYPWLLQWGFGKAGFYGYDLLEGIGSPSGLRSADQIIPAFQSLKPGDKVLMNDIAYLTVRGLEPNRSIVLTGDMNGKPISAMTWLIVPFDTSHSRLVNRFRFVQMWNDPLLPLTMITEFGDTVAIRKIMLGIKDRAEGRAEPLGYQAIEIGSWLLTIIAFFAAVVLMFRRQEWRRAWIMALLAAGCFLIVFFLYPPLWLATLLVVCLYERLLWVSRSKPPMFDTRTSTAGRGSLTSGMRGAAAS